MVTHRENVFEGVKERLSDGAKYVRKKVAQVQEKVVAFSCMIINTQIEINYFGYRCCR